MNNVRISLPFIPLLQLLFIGLKLTNHITWSWFLVLLPITLPFYIFGAFGLVVLISYLLNAIGIFFDKR